MKVFKGRISRLTYLFAQAIVIIIYVALYSLIYWWSSNTPLNVVPIRELQGLSLMIITAVEVMLVIPLYVRRVHDMNFPGWVAILAPVIIGVLATNISGPLQTLFVAAPVIWTLLWPGSAGKNDYGKGPMNLSLGIYHW
jgi:uncharacterized membrane protein YhaH (DUF805 family)